MAQNQVSLRRIVGLTGGIATGKSTVASYLADLGAPILDADVYARQSVQPGSQVLNLIIQRYGVPVVSSDGQLNRKALADIIFSNQSERLWLEAQTHPYVRDRLQTELQSLLHTPAVVMVVPLLFEAQMTDLVTEIWVIACPQSVQLQRLVTRDSLTLDQAKSRIASQLPLSEKIAQADVVLDNSSSRAALLQQVDRAWAIEPPQSPLADRSG
jgi:dephospho-CoA kinase